MENTEEEQKGNWQSDLGGRKLSLRLRKVMTPKRFGGKGAIQKELSKIPLSQKMDSKDLTLAVPIKKKRRYKPGTVALREIRKLQRSTHFLIPKTRMRKLIFEISQEGNLDSFRFKREAIEAIHTAAEEFLIQVMKDANHAAIHSDRKTIMKKDFQLLQKVNLVN